MDGQPTLPGIDIFAIFDEMVTAAESAEAFVEDALLKFYTAAEVGDETCVNARSLIDEFRGCRARFLIL